MSFAMSEPEPMQFKRDYGLRPDPQFNRSLGARVRAERGREKQKKAKPLTKAQRKAVGKAKGTMVDVAARFDLSFATVSRCRKEFQESTEGADAVSGPSEVVAGGTPNDEPRAAKNSPGIKDHLL